MTTWLRAREAQSARRLGLGLSGVVEFLTPPSPGTDIVASPQVPFRGERVTIPSTMGVAAAPLGTFAPGVDLTVKAADFLILDIVVGNGSQLVASGGIPGAVFAEDAYGVALNVDGARVAQNVVIRVSYVGALSTAMLTSGTGPIVVPFRAAIIGTASV